MERVLLAPRARGRRRRLQRVPVGDRALPRQRGPDEPFGGGEPDEDFEGGPGTTGQVMRFTVVDRVGPEASVPPIRLPPPPPPGAASRTRSLALLEADSEVLTDGSASAAFLGVMDGTVAVPMSWDDEVTEHPELGDTEVWSSTTTRWTPTPSTCTWCSSRSWTARRPARLLDRPRSTRRGARTR